MRVAAIPDPVPKPPAQVRCARMGDPNSPLVPDDGELAVNPDWMAPVLEYLASFEVGTDPSNQWGEAILECIGSLVSGSRSVARDLPLTERLEKHVHALCAHTRAASEGHQQAGRLRTIGAGRQARTAGKGVHLRPEEQDGFNGRQK